LLRDLTDAQANAVIVYAGRFAVDTLAEDWADVEAIAGCLMSGARAVA
jgi:hypothetical protein